MKKYLVIGGERDDGRINNGQFKESIVNIPDRMKNASTPCHVAPELNTHICCQLSIRVYIQFVSLCKKEFVTNLETARRGDAARSGTFFSRIDATVIRFRGQIDAKSKIALQGNGTHSSIPRKRSIARQVIGIVKNGVRAKENGKERERLRKTYAASASICNGTIVN